jgi:hypothetical protein
MSLIRVPLEIGARYGKLTVIGQIFDKRRTRSVCKCDCGRQVNVVNHSLRSGNTKSCGCSWAEARFLNGKKRTTHGESRDSRISTEYRIYAGIKTRCFNKKDAAYVHYGGRGITMCGRWLGPLGFQNFLEDVGRRPSPKYSLDRYPDMNGNYEPSNVRWATDFQQARNKRNNLLLTFENRTQCLSAWAEELKMSRVTIGHRLMKGMSVEDALTTPLDLRKRRTSK